MKERFFAPNYALMRHAKDEGWGDQIRLTQSGIETCRAVAETLSGKLRWKKVRIFHSPRERARLTANLVWDILQSRGIEVADPLVLNWLDEVNEEVSDVLLQSVVTEDTDTFYLFVTHLPQVGNYIGVDWHGMHAPARSTIVSREFTIDGDRGTLIPH